MSSLYEQIKSDLGYLKLDAAASSFAGLADQARTEDWTHIDFLARLVAIQASADRDRRLAARMRYARFPFHRRIEDFDFDQRFLRTWTQERVADDSSTSLPSASVDSPNR